MFVQPTEGNDREKFLLSQTKKFIDESVLMCDEQCNEDERRQKMTNQERVLQAVENIINEFGNLRNDGVVSDMWYKHMHELRKAAWNAYYEQKAIVEKQKELMK